MRTIYNFHLLNRIPDDNEFQPDGSYNFPIDPNRTFKSDPNKDIDFVLIYKIPVHNKDPELVSGNSTPNNHAGIAMLLLA